jgi:predicted metal-binding membrane protein
MAGGWALMLVAMMLPLLSAPIGHVKDRSFARRRARATTIFLAGYAAVWMAAGAVLVPLALALVGLGGTWPAIAAALAVIAWQVSPLKQVCLNRLHGHPELPAFGRVADAGVLRFGLEHGAWCFGSCGGIMLLPMLFPAAHLPAMAAASFWVWGEQLGRPAAPGWSLRIPWRALRLALGIA